MQKRENDWLEVLDHYISNPNKQSYKQLDVVLDDKPQEFVMKVILIGDGAVGKTSIRERYLGHGFSAQYLVTIGADFASKRDTIGSKKVRFQIWDLAGQPRFEVVRTLYYGGAKAAFVVCDVSKPASILNINNWVNELWKNSGQGPVPFVILGNKSDLKELGIKCVSDEDLQNMAAGLTSLTEKDFNFRIIYLPTSAKTGLNITKAFRELAIQALMHREFLSQIR